MILQLRCKTVSAAQPRIFLTIILRIELVPGAPPGLGRESGRPYAI